MAPTTRRGHNTPTSNTNPNNMTPESVQAMIDLALQRNSTSGDASHSSHGDDRRNVQTARPCFYVDFMKCQPLNFKGTKCVVGLILVDQKDIGTLGPEAYSMTWEVLKKKITDKYCPQGEIKKLEIELWNLKVKGNDVPTYTERFQELTLILTPSDIQHSAATQIWGCYRLVSRAKVIENQSCLLHHLRLPTLPSTPTLSQGGYFREPMRRYLTEYIPLEDEHEFRAEEQPLPPVVSPTAVSPGYVVESDPEEDPEEYEDAETEDGLVYCLMDGGDDGDDDDGDSSGDDADDEDEDVIPPPSTDITTTGARITVRLQASISLPPEAEVDRLLAMPTPSPSPPISLSPPSVGERLARCTAPPVLLSPPPVPSPLLPSSGCPTQIQTLRIASTQALIDAVTAALPSPPLPPLPPSLYIPPPVDRRDDVPESELSPRQSTVDAEARRQGISKVGYGIRDTWVDPAEAVPEIAPMTVGEVNTRVTELAELHKHDRQDLYALLEDAQDGRTRISHRVAMDSQRVNLLMGDRMTLQETVWIMEEEAYASREAWAHSIGLSQATHQELQTHRDHVYAYETHIQAHQAQLQLQSTLIQTQHQAQMAETLRVMRDMRREMSDMQAELLAHREQQRRARQPGPDARIPDHQDASGDADSHIYFSEDLTVFLWLTSSGIPDLYLIPGKPALRSLSTLVLTLGSPGSWFVKKKVGHSGCALNNVLNMCQGQGRHKRHWTVSTTQLLPRWKWDKITMDFITTSFLRRPHDFDTIWVSSKPRGTTVSIICDRDGRFTSNFWRSIQKALGTDISMSIAYLQNTIWSKARRDAQDRQKSYADLKRKPMEFKVGDRVMLKGVVLPREMLRCEPLAMSLERNSNDDKLQFVDVPLNMKRESNTIKAKPDTIG
ncbi:hypothetical protein Tco_1401187 [Tanacetum coccineum]